MTDDPFKNLTFSDNDYRKLKVVVDELVSFAYAQGRLWGLEEAARMCENEVAIMLQVKANDNLIHLCKTLARDIRQLKEKK